MRQTKGSKIRADGWTAGRQLRFLGALADTRSVSKAADAAGMSRESAYRLRGRREGVLFAALWDEALAARPDEVHTAALPDGPILRLLGSRFSAQTRRF
jgi:hypothetical protein